MQYYFSLPNAWSVGNRWPVVVAVESARRDFRANANDFVKARGSLPFIVVAPLVVTNGGTSGKTSPPYPYSDAVWNEIARVGDF